MEKGEIALYLLLMVTLVQFSTSQPVFNSTPPFKTALTNIVTHNNELFVSAIGRRYRLSESLGILKEINTCPDESSADCLDTNTVLMVWNNSLVTCGTENNGSCFRRSLEDLQPVPWKDFSSDFRVSVEDHRPAVGLLSGNGTFLLATTYGRDLETIERHDTFRYRAINTYPGETFLNPKRLFLNIVSKEQSRISAEVWSDYRIYYKTGFQHDGFNYFLTNQKNLVGDTTFVSKMVRICQEDVGFGSYTDIVIECSNDGKTYNLLQDATVVEPGSTPGVKAGDRLFVGTFTSADNPEDVSGDSAICVEKLSILDERIMEAKKEAISCSTTPIPKFRRYLEQHWTCGQTKYDESLARCTRGMYAYKFIIGQYPYSMVPAYTLSSDQGYITTVSGQFVDATNTTTVLAGTSRGNLIQLVLVAMNESLKEYGQSPLDEGSMIRAILNVKMDKEDAVYVMSTNKIFRYVNTNCTRFTSCEEVVREYNPHCGWCVYEQRSTTKAECQFRGPNHWLSFKDECVEIQKVRPQNMPANNMSNEVTITLNRMPGVLPGDRFECRFLVNDNIVYKHPASLEQSSEFTCLSERVSVHTKGVVQLWMLNDGAGEVRLAQTDILFYKCEHYFRFFRNSCGRCLILQRKGLSCNWCDQSLTCETGCQGVFNISDCPVLLKHPVSYIASNISTRATFAGARLINAKYTCLVPVLRKTVVGKQEQNNVSCDFNLEIPPEAAKKNYTVFVMYELADKSQATLDVNGRNKVTVYKCENLASDCSHCRGLNSTRYKCDWCTSGSCGYKDGTCEPTSQCPAPVITQIVPQDGPTKGNTVLTVLGTDLGTRLADVKQIKIGDIQCNDLNIMQWSDDLDFEEPIIDKVTCTLGSLIDLTLVNTPLNVTVSFNATESVLDNAFVFKEPRIWSISPTFGIRSGGTRVTFTGDNLGTGHHEVSMKYNKAAKFTDCEVIPMIDIEEGANNFTIECNIPTTITMNMTKVQVFYGSSLYAYTFSVNFTALEDPVINVADISPKKAILSGGNRITIKGDNLNHANRAELIVEDQHDRISSPCTIRSKTEMVCETPAAPPELRSYIEGEWEMEEIRLPHRRRRDASCHCKEDTIRIKMDGWSKTFNITYFLDPIIEEFQDEVTLFDNEEQTLVIRGSRMTLVASDSDITVMVGAEECTLVRCTLTTLYCQAPEDQPEVFHDTSYFPEVVVTIGNVEKHVGYLQYADKMELYLIIVCAASGLVIFTTTIGIVCLVYRYRRRGRKNVTLQQRLTETEMEVKNVAKEEFLDMNLMMASMNKSLVEHGFPFHCYQQFASNIIFASDCRLSEFGAQEELHMKTRTAMERLETLLLNKFFLLSVISTMEKQKKFFQRERAILAGNLCAILMGKMDYLQEILDTLVTNLVDEAVGKKQHKTLFRRCESITENVLNNWLALTHYPQLKHLSGSPLYLLFLALQKAIESGPIDALTDDTKYTLCENRLLRKWSSNEKGSNEVKLEAKPLILKVIVDDGEQVCDCRALDCDTITQVKAKCLNQIYVNYPASQLDVDPTELCLEWVTGFTSSKIQLKDEDSTSVSDGDWLRLNTLAHYCVQNNSNMALVDPKYVYSVEDVDASCNNNLGSRELLTSPYTGDSQSPLPTNRWHLVKPLQDNNEKQEKSATESLYLSRLFTTKNLILGYVNQLFSVIMDANQCPPPAKYLCDLLDTLGDRHTLDPRVVQGWKSHSYAIRTWGSLLKQPSILLDVHVPSYVETSLDVIAQVFIDSVSMTPQKLTANSSPQKLVFQKEVAEYQEKLKVFYEGVSQSPQSPEELRQYLHTVHKLQQQQQQEQQQQQQHFDKTAHLYKFYKQLHPYLDDILDDLSTNENTRRLELSGKLEQSMAIMSNTV